MSKKTSVPVKLPPAFVEFMHDVATAIESRDKSAMLESDDLLQCDVAFGGLYDGNKMQYGFTYSPTEDGEITWEFDLSMDEVLQIAAGKILEVRLWSCQEADCKSLHSSRDAYCSNCDNVLDYVDEEAEFRKSYPEESNDEILRLMNMRRVVFAIIDYHEANGHFPPPYTQNEEGRRLHSCERCIRDVLTPLIA